MRFARRDKNRPLWGRMRRTTSDRQGEESESPSESVDADERNALLDDSRGNEYDAEPAPETVAESQSVSNEGDTTQRLLTTLGRFQRHVARARAGAEQAEWSDDCMDELITAVELSLSQGSRELVEALTGAGRILQTYEDAGCAHLSVPFLSESYELLCLMVGDLIVGDVRPGVMNKWRERYAQAVADVRASGLTLVYDEDETEDLEEEPRDYEPEVPPQIHTMENRAAAARQKPPERQEAVAEDQDQPQTESKESKRDTQKEAAPHAGPAPATPQPEVEEGIGNAEDEQQAPAGTGPEIGIPPEVASILDELCDELARLEQDLELEPAQPLRAVQEKVASLDTFAIEAGHDQPAELCKIMTKLCGLALAQGRAREDRFLDVAYGFCEAYAESGIDSDSAVVYNWSMECAGLADAWQSVTGEGAGGLAPEQLEEAFEDASPEAAPTAPTARPETDHAEQGLGTLLNTAQAAIADGNVSDAKAMMLEAAVNLAKLEKAKAEARVHDSELRLQESATVVDEARKAAKEVEAEVAEAENNVTAGKRECTHIKTHAGKILEVRDELRHHIMQLDAQIAELQAQRDAESERVVQTESQLEDIRSRQAEAEQYLRRLMDQEKTLRGKLEQARQRVRDLQGKRSQLQTVLDRDRDVLTGQIASLEDIQRTLEQISNAAGPASDTEDLLF